MAGWIPRLYGVIRTQLSLFGSTRDCPRETELRPMSVRERLIVNLLPQPGKPNELRERDYYADSYTLVSLSR